MPTPRKTIEQLKLTGTYQQNKRRYEDRLNPVPAIQQPVGRPSLHLSAPERAIWAEVTKNAPEGLLGRPDRLIIEVATKFIAQMRGAGLKASELSALVAVLGKLGMTPDSRRKMHIELPVPIQPKEKSVWDELDELD